MRCEAAASPAAPPRRSNAPPSPQPRQDTTLAAPQDSVEEVTAAGGLGGPPQVSPVCAWPAYVRVCAGVAVLHRNQVSLC
ncbi:hypothetical protein E2C01_083033 [Portunus trituberculatus]|uniref:Uncharacterized protein n=1 Tax=Portunus trituberculatus TaxID=210409 RepID=A0A5B7J0N8_PORTR|nr:hypothetical protein [Portunus trituberculatus]